MVQRFQPVPEKEAEKEIETPLVVNKMHRLQRPRHQLSGPAGKGSQGVVTSEADFRNQVELEMENALWGAYLHYHGAFW